jgi:hypothetical protein
LLFGPLPFGHFYPDEAKRMQESKLVRLNTAPAHGIAGDDR